jgi:YNFM family putative membrane transporter
MLARTLVIGLLSFLTLIDLFGAQALLPRLTAAFGVSAAAMGFAVNATTLGMAAAGIAVAYFSRSIERKSGIWISLALLALPTFALGFVEDLTAFTLLRIAQGVFMSAAFTLTMAYLAEECSVEEAAGAMAAYITGNVVSNLAGRLMAANFADWLGLSGSFWAFAALNLAGAALAAHCLARTTPREAAGQGDSPLAVWQRHLAVPALRAGFVIGFLILFVFIGVFTYVNFVLVAPPFALSGAALGLVYLVFLPSVLTTPLAARMVARLGVQRAFLTSMTVAAIGIAALLVPSLPVVLGGLALVGVGTFCAQAAVTGFIGAAAASDRAAASGLYLASYYVGGLVGALALGRVFATLGWPATVAVLVAAAGLAMVVAQRLRTAPTAGSVAARSPR